MQGLWLLFASVSLFVHWRALQALTEKLSLTLIPLTPRSVGGQVVGERDPEAGSGGAGAPVPEGVALSSCWISTVC